MLDFELWTSSYGEVTNYTVECVEKLHNTGLRFTWRFQAGDALIGRSRSIAAYNFLKDNNSPYMVFLDGDIVFSVKDMEKLIQSLREGRDVVGGLYPVRGSDFLAQRGFNGQMRITGEPEEVQFVSTGFVGISRSILSKIVDGMPLLNTGNWSECYPVFESGRYESIYISEDWDFCNKVREAGSKVYAHTGIQLRHLKEQLCTAQEAIEKTCWIPKDSTVMDELAEYTGKELMPQAVATKQLAGLWMSWTGSDMDFYTNGEVGSLYLYDLAGFNSSQLYRDTRLKAILNADHLNILDIGSGIGTAAIELSAKNHLVVGYEPNPVLRDFADFRKDKHNLRNCYFVDTMPELSKFDLVVAIDTLEHIRDLESFLHTLSGMKSGAKFYHHDVFWELEVSPMHFDHSQGIDGWLKDSGFIKWDSHWAMRYNHET